MKIETDNYNGPQLLGLRDADVDGLEAVLNEWGCESPLLLDLENRLLLGELDPEEQARAGVMLAYMRAHSGQVRERGYDLWRAGLRTAKKAEPVAAKNGMRSARTASASRPLFLCS